MVVHEDVVCTHTHASYFSIPIFPHLGITYHRPQCGSFSHHPMDVTYCRPQGISISHNNSKQAHNNIQVSISRHLTLIFYRNILYHIFYLTFLVPSDLLKGNSSYAHLTKVVLFYLYEFRVLSYSLSPLSFWVPFVKEGLPSFPKFLGSKFKGKGSLLLHPPRHRF